jgi:hypothetical protein
MQDCCCDLAADHSEYERKGTWAGRWGCGTVWARLYQSYWDADIDSRIARQLLGGVTVGYAVSHQPAGPIALHQTSCTPSMHFCCLQSCLQLRHARAFSAPLHKQLAVLVLTAVACETGRMTHAGMLPASSLPSLFLHT